MTDIDPQADIEVHSADEHVTVGVPLAGAVTGEWLRCYQKLALAKEVPVQPQVHDDRAWIVVSMPASSSRGEVAATLDAARALIANTDAEQPPATATAEASVRDWWAGRRESASRGPGSVTGAAQARAERRWPMASPPPDSILTCRNFLPGLGSSLISPTRQYSEPLRILLVCRAAPR